MLIAQQKKAENIAEYILYMFQIEDIIRAYDFDVDRIMENFVLPQLPDKSFENQYRDWYTGLINQMRSQRIEKHGHTNEVKEVLVEISYMHNTLMNLSQDSKYITLFETAMPVIEEFKAKSNVKDRNEIEVMFHALYMKLLMRLKKQEISAETEDAFDKMRVVLAYLAKAYKQMKSGNMDFLKN